MYLIEIFGDDACDTQCLDSVIVSSNRLSKLVAGPSCYGSLELTLYTAALIQKPLRLFFREIVFRYEFGDIEDIL